jgi:hypothetical protein
VNHLASYNRPLTLFERCLNVVKAERTRLDIQLANHPADIEARAALVSVEKIRQALLDLKYQPLP